MKKLSWFDYEETTAILARHNKSGKLVMAIYDSVCIFWDFYAMNQNKSGLVHCYTNVNEIAEKNFTVVEVIGKIKTKEDNVTSFMFYPDFEKFLNKI